MRNLINEHFSLFDKQVYLYLIAERNFKYFISLYL